MEKIKVIHDMLGKTLTVWFDDPNNESVCEETSDEVVLMKNNQGKVIGFELLHYESADQVNTGINVETVIKTGTFN